VTVIGNPGLGSEILTHTMTTGIVSSPGREIDGLNYIQTSAAVNPGNSGGPLFDSLGRVIGLVVLKAKIEGTAFAVPSKDLREFLEKAAKSAN
jgi:serine protease Do